MNKLKTIFIFATTLTAIVILWSFVKFDKSKISKPAAVNKGFAVVELFTSEGCSSCPPADEAIAELLSKKINNVYILTYHVDYWNRLGWKDVFSQHAFSERQQQYAAYLSLDGVYTPQAIVNGFIQFTGADKNRLDDAISKGLNGSKSNLNITAEKKDDNVIVHYKLDENESMLLNTALVLPEASTNVKRGENGGRILKHVNIVTAMQVKDIEQSGEVSINIPNELINKPLKVIAYTQSKKDFHVTGADEVSF